MDKKIDKKTIFSFSYNVFNSFLSQGDKSLNCAVECWVRFIFPSPNAFILDMSIILLFDKDLTLSPMYTHFNTLKKKPLGKDCENRWNCSKWAISPFATMFSLQFVSLNTLIATFQLSSAASLNLGQSQNGVLGNGLMCCAQNLEARWVIYETRESPAQQISFPGLMMDIVMEFNPLSSLITDLTMFIWESSKCFWEEREIKESKDKCTGHHAISEIILLNPFPNDKF